MKASSSVATPRPAISAAGVSLTSTRPRCIREMRSQRSASFMKWVEMKIVTRSRRDSSISRRQNASRATGSTPDVGSSRISSSGRCTMATASDRRWRMPSGMLSGRLSLASRRPKRSSMPVTRSAISRSGTWNSRACSSRFCRTVSSPYNENDCDM